MNGKSIGPINGSMYHRLHIIRTIRYLPNLPQRGMFAAVWPPGEPHDSLMLRIVVLAILGRAAYDIAAIVHELVTVMREILTAASLEVRAPLGLIVMLLLMVFAGGRRQ